MNPDARERRWGEGAAKVTARYVAGAGFLRKVADLPVCESPAGASRSRLARGLPRCGRQAGGRADVTPNFFQTEKCVSFLATDRKNVQILTASHAFSDVFAQIPVGQFTQRHTAPGLAPKRVQSKGHASGARWDPTNTPSPAWTSPRWCAAHGSEPPSPPTPSEPRRRRSTWRPGARASSTSPATASAMTRSTERCEPRSVSSRCLTRRRCLSGREAARARGTNRPGRRSWTRDDSVRCSSSETASTARAAGTRKNPTLRAT